MRLHAGFELRLRLRAMAYCIPDQSQRHDPVPCPGEWPSARVPLSRCESLSSAEGACVAVHSSSDGRTPTNDGVQWRFRAVGAAFAFVLTHIVRYAECRTQGAQLKPSTQQIHASPYVVLAAFSTATQER